MPNDLPVFAVPATVMIHAQDPHDAEVITERLEGVPLDQLIDADGFLSFGASQVQP